MGSCEYYLGLYKYDTAIKYTATRTARPIGMVDRLRTEKYRNRGSVPGKCKSILYSPKRFRLGFWAAQTSVRMVPGLERPRRGSDLPHLSNFKIKNEWGCTSRRPYAFLRSNSIHAVGSSKMAQVVRFGLLIWRGLSRIPIGIPAIPNYFRDTSLSHVPAKRRQLLS